MHKYLPTNRHGSYYTSMLRLKCIHFPFKQAWNFNHKFVQFAYKQTLNIFKLKNIHWYKIIAGLHSLNQADMHSRILIYIKTYKYTFENIQTSKYSSEYTQIVCAYMIKYIYLCKKLYTFT